MRIWSKFFVYAGLLFVSLVGGSARALTEESSNVIPFTSPRIARSDLSEDVGAVVDRRMDFADFEVRHLSSLRRSDAPVIILKALYDRLPLRANAQKHPVQELLMLVREQLMNHGLAEEDRERVHDYLSAIHHQSNLKSAAVHAIEVVFDEYDLWQISDFDLLLEQLTSWASPLRHVHTWYRLAPELSARQRLALRDRLESLTPLRLPALLILHATYQLQDVGVGTLLVELAREFGPPAMPMAKQLERQRHFLADTRTMAWPVLFEIAGAIEGGDAVLAEDVQRQLDVTPEVEFARREFFRRLLAGTLIDVAAQEPPDVTADDPFGLGPTLAHELKHGAVLAQEGAVVHVHFGTRCDSLVAAP